MSLIKYVNPAKLYPLVSIESIDPIKLNKIVEQVQKGRELPLIRVIRYEGYYFVIEGNYAMLAANITHRSKISIEVVDLSEVAIWSTTQNIKDQLKSIGVNALYDFEALGGFRYIEHPVFYKGES